jgi:hypothetical protein
MTDVKPFTTLAQLEKWFDSSHENPSASSRVAAAMRELLKLNPHLSFDELRELARSQLKRVEGVRLARENPV